MSKVVGLSKNCRTLLKRASKNGRLEHVSFTELTNHGVAKNVSKSPFSTQKADSPSSAADDVKNQTKPLIQASPLFPGEKRQYSKKIKEIGDGLMSLDMVENFLLQAYIAEKLGLTMDQYINLRRGGTGGPQTGPANAGDAKAEAPKEEKKPQKQTFTLKLTKLAADSKFKVVKEIRTIKPDLNLAQAKALVDNLPSVIVENVSKEEGDKLIEKLKATGGTFELV